MTLEGARQCRIGLGRGINHREKRLEILPEIQCADCAPSTESEFPGVFVISNYVAGVSTSACIDGAFATAARAEAYLSGGNRNDQEYGFDHAHKTLR